MRKPTHIRWRKALRDLWLNKARTLLVILAIATGVFGLGLVANSYAILTREMQVNYLRTNPASATLYTRLPLSRELVAQVRARPEIAEAEARRMVEGRVRVGPDEWKGIWLFVIDDFSNLRLDTFVPESGQYPAADGEILLERAALSVARAEVGQGLQIKIPNQAARELALVGSVHAPGLAPAWMEGFAYGFITPGTLASLGGDPSLTELKVTVAEAPLDKAAIQRTAYALKDWLAQQGYPVYRIEIPEPGKHPHATQMATLLFLLEAFGLVALLLSGVLTATMIAALLAQQVRQIGVMKAIGASTGQVAGLYFGMVLLLGLAGLAPGMLAALAAGRGYAAFAAQMLNFRIFSYRVPLPYLALQAAVGLLIPLLAASYPVLRGSRTTVRAAISDYGIRAGSAPAGKAAPAAGAAVRPPLPGRLPRPFLLSLRNTFRQRGRLLLTLATLAVGGAGFITAMNVQASMDATVAAKFDAARYDLQFSFSQVYPEETIQAALQSEVGVRQVESWGGARAERVAPDGTASSSFSLIAPPAQTRLMTSLPLLAGRWLQPEDRNTLVVNHALLARLPGVQVGDEVVLRIAGQDSTWKLVGVVREIMGLPAAYTNQESLDARLGLAGRAQGAVVVAQERDPQAVAGLARRLERRLAAEGVDVAAQISMGNYRQAIEDHLLLLASFLLLMSALVVAVGGLGLASTMSINVLERTREIGVLRAIGASTPALLAIIVSEGVLIGGLSWLAAVMLSWPVSAFVSYTFGMTFFEAPLRFAVSAGGMLAWLGLALVLAGLASFYPAWRAAQLTVRQTLAYE